MSTLQFPANPVVGDTYDWDAYRYVWDGEKWKTVPQVLRRKQLAEKLVR